MQVAIYIAECQSHKMTIQYCMTVSSNMHLYNTHVLILKPYIGCQVMLHGICVVRVPAIKRERHMRARITVSNCECTLSTCRYKSMKVGEATCVCFVLNVLNAHHQDVDARQLTLWETTFSLQTTLHELPCHEAGWPQRSFCQPLQARVQLPEDTLSNVQMWMPNARCECIMPVMCEAAFVCL